MKTYSIAIAGTTKRTKQVAESLLSTENLPNNTRFSIPWILTPQPRKVSRKQILTKNPLHKLAEEKEIPTVLIDKKIDAEIKKAVEKLPTPDFLLVVDFGFIVPKWLLDLPREYPLNIHPSLLPKWRGSSPGQFVLLNGDRESAVTIMVMNEKLDQGPILKQINFTVDSNWTQNEYYQHSFDLVCGELGKVIVSLAADNLKPQAQPNQSPTPVARRLSKKDSFIEWKMLENAKNLDRGAKISDQKFGPLNLTPTPENIANACRAFNPWPKLWTMKPTNQEEKRMIIHACHVETDQETKQSKLILDEVQIEGKQKKKVENNLL